MADCMSARATNKMTWSELVCHLVLLHTSRILQSNFRNKAQQQMNFVHLMLYDTINTTIESKAGCAGCCDSVHMTSEHIIHINYY
jgi:hypothetical protein